MLTVDDNLINTLYENAANRAIHTTGHCRRRRSLVPILPEWSISAETL